MVSAVALRWSLVATERGFRICALALLICWLPLKASPENYEGKPISSITFEPARQPSSNAKLAAMLPIKVGEPLRAEAIREAIQRLYATGEYTDISADASLDGAGVALKFITKPAYFVGHVAVSGVPEPPSEGQLVTATKLQLGTEYSKQDVTQAVETLQNVLRRNGFYEAVVTPRTQADAASQQMSVEFLINPGKRARFDGVLVTGDPERSVSSVIRSTGWHRLFGGFGWRPVTENRVQSGVEGVRGWYQKHDRLLANVRLDKLDYHEDAHTVTPTLDIRSGPLVTVELEGAKVSKSRLRSLLPIYQERAVDKDLLVEGRRDLVQYFQAQGYFEAAADFNTEADPSGEQLITYSVRRGTRHKLAVLEIEGNRYFDTATLRERLYVAPATFLRFRHGRFSQSYLERDLNAIRDLYHSNGFRDVEVTAEETDDYRGKEGDIAVSIRVKEGPQWFVASLKMEGVTSDDERRLRGILHSTEGQPYSDLNIATDRDSVLDFYYNNGYPNVKFDFTSAPSPDPNRMDLLFTVRPGERQYVRDVLVRGLETTNPDIVLSRIVLRKGDPLSQGAMTASQRRLYDLGIFARVNAAIQNPEGDEPDKYVLYSVEEARRYSMNIGFGAEIARIGGGTTTLDSPAGTTGFSPRVSFGINRLNFLGIAHTLGFQTLLSTLEQRALVTYLAPRFQGNPNLALQFNALFDISRDVRTFSSRREEGSVQFVDKLSRANSIQFRYTFRKVNILGTPLVTPELIPLLSQPVRVGIVSMAFVQDRRDDPLDARRGIYNTIDIGFAANPFGSQTGFGRVVARNATYHRLTKNVVLARQLSFGLIDRYSGLSDIPLAERFFSGGSSSHRAFPDNQAGPRDTTTGFPIGGRALLINSVELRFPLVGDNLGGVLFNDMGNVYTGLSDISFRFRQKNLQDFDYAVASFGFGVRYRTPIGPVRLDLSLSPNSPRFFGFKGTLDQLLFGGGVQTVQRINVFQFHFSLGQAF
jgi:outer membrane protein insertion porin family